MDEHTVKRIINELAGAKALMEEMDEYQGIVLRMRRERPHLAADYPDKWVAMGGRGFWPQVTPWTRYSGSLKPRV